MGSPRDIANRFHKYHHGYHNVPPSGYCDVVFPGNIPRRQSHVMLLHRIPRAFPRQTSSSDDCLPEIASFVTQLAGRPSPRRKRVVLVYVHEDL